MALGDSRHYDMRAIQKRHWFETAKRCGFDTRVLQTLMDDLLARLDALKASPLRLPRGFPPSLYGHTINGIAQQTARLIA
jgi:hypothetical protein